jgi:uncharacterized protein (TIGR03118 family)
MRGFVIVSCLLVVSLAGVAPASASPFQLAVLASSATDPQLVNPWGIAASGGSPFWIGSDGSRVSELYNGAGMQQPLIVNIPGDGSVTGVVFSNVAGSFNGDTFLFNSQDGTISGWRGALGTTAETLQVADAFNVYTGLAQAVIGGNAYAYSANFFTGHIDAEGQFSAPSLAGLHDPGAIRTRPSTCRTSAAFSTSRTVKDQATTTSGAATARDEFNLDSTFVGRLVTGGALDSPWGTRPDPAGLATWLAISCGVLRRRSHPCLDPNFGALIER